MKRAFMKGNDAVICGALAGGCRAFFGYPITPASEIAHDAMRIFPKIGGIAIQAESEIAAINMLYGAGAGGDAAMTATSGPGLSLMQEGISYMAAARIPGVIVDIMRAGPGLGNIGPEQGDYQIAVHGGGHGHYQTPVLAPASVQEMFDMTRQAFEIAFQYRTPTFVIADAFIGQMMETIRMPETMPAREQTAAARYPFTEAADGTPGTRGNVVSSLELDCSKLYEKNNRRFQNYDAMAQNLQRAEISPVCTDSRHDAIIVIAFGICARLAHEAVRHANSRGAHAILFRPLTLNPFPLRLLTPLLTSNTQCLVIECNRGMMQADIERITPRSNVCGMHRDGGILPSVEEIVDFILSHS